MKKPIKIGKSLKSIFKYGISGITGKDKNINTYEIAAKNAVITTLKIGERFILENLLEGHLQ
ncbi:hypothetical protein LALCM10_130089 [Dellaglioa algida]|nr:hypothetical protein LALCM10_130089 [Dellaglioa algida]